MQYYYERMLEHYEPPIGHHSINVLNLRTRTLNALVGDNIRTVEDLKALRDYELLRLPNFGKVCLSDVHEALQEWEDAKHEPLVPVVYPPPPDPPPDNRAELRLIAQLIVEVRDAIKAMIRVMDQHWN